jgi:exonuclease III
MSIDEIAYSPDGSLALPPAVEAVPPSPYDGLVHQVAIQAFRAGSYLTNPLCHAHELWRRMSVVDLLHPASHPLLNTARKVSLSIMISGWAALSLFTILPGIALRYLGVYLQKQPFIHVQHGEKGKNLPTDRSFSMLSWNICGINAGYSVTDAGVMHWRYRIDDIIKKVIEKDADVNCLIEVFDINTAYYLCDKLKSQGYREFYFNVGANPIGISSGVFIASKYTIKNPEFTRFPIDMLVGRTKAAAKGIFAFDLESEKDLFTRMHVTHLQHSEEPAFSTKEEVESRRAQMGIVLDKIHAVKDRCAILTGDLNLDDEEYQTSPWRHHFERMDFGEDKTWGGDGFCASLVGKLVSEPLNLDYTLITPGFLRPIENSIVASGFDGTVFKTDALSDHAGLYTRFNL